MPTETGKDLMESIRAQLGLEPMERTEPEGGMDAWLQEFEPEMFGEDEEMDEGRTRPAFKPPADAPPQTSRKAEAARRETRMIDSAAKNMEELPRMLRDIGNWMVMGNGRHTMTDEQAEAILDLGNRLDGFGPLYAAIRRAHRAIK